MLAVSGSPVSSQRFDPPTRSSCQPGEALTRSPRREAKITVVGPTPEPYPAQQTQPIEPILFPKLRIRLAEFPYATLFYAPETAHLGDLMRIRYGSTGAQRISPNHWLF